MKKVIFAVVLLMLGMNVFPQCIRVETGMSFSSMAGNDNNLFTRNKGGVNLGVAMDYFEHTNFYLTSKIGYLSTGGVGLYKDEETDASGHTTVVGKGETKLRLHNIQA